MREISMTIEETARKAVGLILPVLFATGIPFFVLHGLEPFLQWSWSGVLVFFLCLVIGVPVHELLHALVFGMFARGGYKSVKFGIEPRTYTPYCHCTSPIRVQYYRLGALMPFLVLGLPLMLLPFSQAPWASGFSDMFILSVPVGIWLQLKC